MLDWTKWKRPDMNLLEFLLLNLVFTNATQKLPFELNDEISVDLYNTLEAKGYVRSGFNKLYITPKGMAVFESNNIMFEKFFNLFPQKVPNGNSGYRILRSVDIGSRNASEAFRKWKMVTGNNSKKEEHIFKCLEAEVIARHRNGDLQYMNNIITWLHGRKWEFYEHLIDDIPKEVNTEKSI